jgi:hypothetical protein
LGAARRNIHCDFIAVLIADEGHDAIGSGRKPEIRPWSFAVKGHERQSIHGRYHDGLAGAIGAELVLDLNVKR